MSSSIRSMIADIENDVHYTSNLTGRDELAPTVMQAMQEVPRDAFVPKELKSAAFRNGPLPIGHNQTISQPYIVALMTDLLDPTPTDKVLEVGTGSGYQAAILSRLCSKVYTVELIAALAESASDRLAALGYLNVICRIGNGYQGWAENAPYDGIIVTAAAPYIPATLVNQLKPGGNLVIPLGQPHSFQELVQVVKDEKNNVTTKNILGVSFVPLVDQSESGYPYESTGSNQRRFL